MFEFLALLFIKHYVIDFVLQTEAMVKGKGIYGNPDGIIHSLQHAFGTALACFICIEQPFYWIVLPIADFLLHYHIDYVKVKYGCRDITKPLFWNHLGLDQLLHSLTYLCFAFL